MKEHWITTRRFTKAASWLWVLLLLAPGALRAQTTYHLHAAASSTPGQFQLQTAGPSATSASFMSGPMTVAGDYQVAGFDTQAGITNTFSYIPAGASATFSFWMQVSNKSGVAYPEAKLYLNSSSGVPLCAAAAGSPLSTIPQQFIFSCTIAVNLPVPTTDRLYLWVGAKQSGKGVPSLKANLSVEGVLNGNYDSQITIPTPVVPVITGLAPTTGSVGTSITITGNNFGTGQQGAVTFNGTPAMPTSWSNTRIVVPVPLGAISGNVVVTVADVPSNGVYFTDTSPSIISLSPPQGPVGTPVTITGANFGSSQGSSTVTFSSVPVMPRSWSDTSINLNVPSLPAGNSPVVVTVNGTATNSVNFGVAPLISNASPGAASVGASIVITGSNFGASRGSSTVLFNGTPATPTTWSDSSIAVPVPPGARSGNIVVVVNGVSSAGLPFTVVPAITSIVPSSASVGMSVTITGTSFGATQGMSTVTFNGVPAIASVWSDTSVTVTIPTSATTGSLVITANGIASNPVRYVVVPVITGILPKSGPTGTPITIQGTGFGDVPGWSTVSIGGANANPTGWSATGIAVTVPGSLSIGDANVVVTVNGVPSNNGIFTVTPGILSLSPTSGSVGTPVTITGTNFGATQGTNSTVTFSGTPATPTTWTNTSIVVPVPNGAAPGNVVVTVNGLSSNGMPFANTSPTISELDPNTAAVGELVEVNGANFGAGQGAVTINGVAAPVAYWSDGRIVVEVPGGAVNGSLQVTAAGATSNAAAFSVNSQGAPAPRCFVAQPHSMWDQCEGP